MLAWLMLFTSAAQMVVTSGRPFRVRWSMAELDRIDGFYLQVDQGTKVNIGKPTPGAPVVNGMIAFEYRVMTGVPRGSHTLRVSAWNYVLGVTSAQTTTRQESDASVVLFAAADETRQAPPLQPNTVVLIR